MSTERSFIQVLVPRLPRLDSKIKIATVEDQALADLVAEFLHMARLQKLLTVVQVVLVKARKIKFILLMERILLMTIKIRIRHTSNPKTFGVAKRVNRHLNPQKSKYHLMMLHQVQIIHLQLVRQLKMTHIIKSLVILQQQQLNLHTRVTLLNRTSK